MIIEEKKQYKEDVYGMWQRNFHDPAPYAAFYFQEVYGNNDILLNIEGEKKKGMLHMNPYRLRIGKESVDAHYIVGVATEEAYRRQGVMRELLKAGFSRLREQGEFLTYLMPADEAYYLPFDFRFGMTQVEQEIEGMEKAKKPENADCYTFCGDLPDDVENICISENRCRDDLFAIHTEITPEYLARLEKETKSDFGRLLFVFCEGEYVGRFVVGAENDYMALSQVVCVRKEGRKEFLRQILYYCESSYHYGKYQVILEETWKQTMEKPGNYGGIRLLPPKEKKIIMFRLLCLEKMAPYLCGDEEAEISLRLVDHYLKEQSGLYGWKITKEGSCITKMDETSREEVGKMTDAGTIGIGALTRILFGDSENRTQELYEGLTGEGRRILSALCPVRPVCIQEIV